MIDKICEGCSNPFRARLDQIRRGNGRFCSHRCYAKSRTYDDLVTRLWRKVDKTCDCWIWTGYVNPDGYGQIGIRGQKVSSTHRVAYALTYGLIPEGMKVLHRCDNPPCCNPEHLFLGTQADNVADMINKGRHKAHAGEKAPAAKLSATEVEAIRQDPASRPGVSKVELARRYNVRVQVIYNILKGKTYHSSKPSL